LNFVAAGHDTLRFANYKMVSTTDISRENSKNVTAVARGHGTRWPPQHTLYPLPASHWAPE